MLLLVSADRRDDKYLFMLLPILCLLAGAGLHFISQAITQKVSIHQRLSASYVVMALFTTGLLWQLWPTKQTVLTDLGQDYDRAFAFVQENWQPSDKVLTGTPSAAALYLGQNDYYAVRGDHGYAYRLLEKEGQLVERWLGSPWLNTDEKLYAVLNSPERVWLVLERWGLLEEYYSPLTLHRLLAMTEFVREDAGIIVLQNKPGSTFFPPEPETSTDFNFDYKLNLQGYHLQKTDTSLNLSTYWQVMNTLPYNYSLFVHVRNAEGANMAQTDIQLLAPIYPTTLWPVDETIRTQTQVALPPNLPSGEYQLWLGLYNLDTLERLLVIDDTSGENAALLTTLMIGD